MRAIGCSFVFSSTLGRGSRRAVGERLGLMFVRRAGHAVTRNPHFATINDSDLSKLETILGKSGVVTDAGQLEAANTDWQRKYFGHSRVLVRPTSVEQVSAVLAYCNHRRIAVVPQGGNTGLVGGATPIFDELILSTSKMNKVIAFDQQDGILTAEAGCILEQLSEYAEPRGFIMPLDIGSKGSCQIGGNVSTNAGGTRYVRYGSLHASVLGIEAVLPNGTVLDCLNTIRKNNTGYDIKQLFIGGEGTLGVVTKVAIQLPPKPKSRFTMLLSLESYSSVLKVTARSKQQLAEILSAVEFLDQNCMGLVTKHLPGAKDPLGPSPFYMVLEVAGSSPSSDQSRLEAFLESLLSEKIITNGTVAQDQKQSKAIWKLREGVAEALTKEGAVYKYDVSLPVGEMYALVEEMNNRLKDSGAKAVGYGHVGDGNLHLNVSVPQAKPSESMQKMIEPYIYERVAQYKGSISAEHGMGQAKNSFMHLAHPPAVIGVMSQVRKLFDPNGIMNPYKLLPVE